MWAISGYLTYTDLLKYGVTIYSDIPYFFLFFKGISQK